MFEHCMFVLLRALKRTRIVWSVYVRYKLSIATADNTCAYVIVSIEDL